MSGPSLRPVQGVGGGLLMPAPSPHWAHVTGLFLKKWVAEKWLWNLFSSQVSFWLLAQANSHQSSGRATETCFHWPSVVWACNVGNQKQTVNTESHSWRVEVGEELNKRNNLRLTSASGDVVRVWCGTRVNSTSARGRHFSKVLDSLFGQSVFWTLRCLVSLTFLLLCCDWSLLVWVAIVPPTNDQRYCCVGLCLQAVRRQKDGQKCRKQSLSWSMTQLIGGYQSYTR